LTVCRQRPRRRGRLPIQRRHVLAARLGYWLQEVEALIAVSTPLTPEVATVLGEALGTSAELWLALEGYIEI
jgi:plasmid maintenance system antidote protein VapI